MIREIGQTILTGTQFELQVTDWQGRFNTISEFTSLESAQAERDNTRSRYPDHEFRIVQITTTSDIVDSDQDFIDSLDQNMSDSAI